MKILLFLFFFVLIVVGVGLGISALSEQPEQQQPQEPNTQQEGDQLEQDEQDTTNDLENEEEATEEEPELLQQPQINQDINEALTDNLFDIVSTQPELSTFAEAITAADLVDFVSTDDSVLTIFAPSNEAFENSSGAYESLLEGENFESLVQTMQFHIIEGKLDATQIASQNTLPTLLEDQSVIVSITDDGLLNIDGVRVETVNLEARNGYIHIINTFLIPNNVSF